MRKFIFVLQENIVHLQTKTNVYEQSSNSINNCLGADLVC